MKPLHSWDISPTEAVALQRELAPRVDISTPLGRLDTVVGCDISYDLGSPVLSAAVVVVRVADGAVVDRAVVREEVKFPYVPGLLSFREAPPILSAWKSLRRPPDAVMVDAQGVAHPRRFGLASHLGLWLGLPCVGCAKSRPVGRHDEPGPGPGPGPVAGDISPLTLADGDRDGVALRSAAGAEPVYVPPGHRVDLAGAVSVVQDTLGGYRMPTPTRLAHVAANEARTAGEAGLPGAG